MNALPELLDPPDAELSRAAEPAFPSPLERKEERQPLWHESLLGAGALSVFDQAVVSGTHFVTNLVLIRWLAPADYGLFALAWSLALFFRGVQEQIISAPFMVYAPKKEGTERESYQGSVLAHQLAFALLASVLVAIGTVFAWTSGEAAAFGVLAAVLPLILLREFARQFAFARLDVRAALGVDILAAAIQLSLIGLLAGTSSAAVVTALACIGAATGLSAAAWLALKSERLAFSWERIVTDWQENWTFGRWTLASQLLATTMTYLLPWILAFSPGGSASTAVLAAGSMLVGVANMFVVGVSNYLTNRAIHAYREEGLAGLRGVLGRTAVLFAATIGLFALGTLFGGQWAADLLFQGKYPDAGPVLGWLAFGALAMSMGVTAGNGLWALERPQANFAADVVSLAATLVAAALCVPLWGATGAAAASCIGLTLAAIVRTWTLLRAMQEIAEDAR